MLNILFFPCQIKLCRPDGSDPRKSKVCSSPQHFFSLVPESVHPLVRGDAEECWQKSEQDPPRPPPGFPIGSHQAKTMRYVLGGG
jgi:hypothetical protein